MKTIILYLLLAGAPILGIFGVLLLGANLQAPAAIHGAWTLTLEIPVQETCQSLSEWDGLPQLAIAQSGPHITIQLNDSAHALLIGTLVENNLTASGAPDYQLTATLDRSAEPDLLRGVLNAPQCFSPLPFTARLQASPRNAAGH
ncbi:MAG: hypothetical protein L0Z70_08805 [Chloroflexi bacterium]|nr:hypothetical protein [Chloroflexota bacterium]